MKTLGQLLPQAAPLAVAVSLVLFSGSLRAFGPGGVGNGGGAVNGGVAGSTVAGAPAGGGSRGGVSAGTGGGSVPAASGARGGVSFSNSGVRPGSGTFTPATGFRGGAPSGLSTPYRNALNGPSSIGGTRSVLSPTATRPANSWSGTAVNPTNTATARGNSHPLYNSNGYTSNRFSGQILYPGANGSNLPSANSWSGRGNSGNGNRNGHPGYRLPGRYYYNPYFYGPVYAPYIGDYVSGSPYYGSAYPYYNDVPAGETNFGPGSTVNPQYVEQSPDTNNNNAQPDSAQPSQPNTAAPQNPNRSTAAQGTIPNNGPDSLVEAVQQELIRRGYFGGKVDAMFGPETKDALRKFQADHHLAESGLINEATLHALQLD